MSQIPLAFPVESSYLTEDFLVADCNREAWLRVTQEAGTPEPVLLLRGPQASGKTHLASIWARSHQAAVVAAAAMTEDCDPLEWFAGRQALWVEDCHQIGNEAALFHLLNAQRQSPCKLLLTVAAEACWDAFHLADLRSRLQALPQIAIEQPDDALIHALILKHFSDYQRDISMQLVDYLVPRVERSFAAVAQLCAKMEAIANERKQPVTQHLARLVLTES